MFEKERVKMRKSEKRRGNEREEAKEEKWGKKKNKK